MAIWKCVIRIPNEKKRETHTYEAPTYADVYNMIADKGWVSEKITRTDKAQKDKKTIVLTLKETTIFCRQFSTMISAGITISKAFDILQTQEKQNKNTKLATLYHEIYEDIQRGRSMYEAMIARESAFPPLLMNMVHAGEISGNLDVIMAKTAVYFEKRSKLMSKLNSSLAYPKFLFIFAIIVCIALFMFVLPQFFVVFEELDVELPWITKLVIAISDFLFNKWYVVAFVVILALFVWKIALTVPAVSYEWDYLKLRMPLLGKCIKKTAIANFTSTMGMMYSSGISLIDSITVSMGVLGNQYYESEFQNIVQQVAAGRMMSQVLLESEIFEPMVSSMLFIGEESGNLEELLIKTSEFYDTEADEALEKLVTAAEPAIIIMIGFIVLALVAAVILPSFTLATGLAEKY